MAVLLEEHMKARPKVVTHFTPVYPHSVHPIVFYKASGNLKSYFTTARLVLETDRGLVPPAERPTDVPVEPAW